MNRMGVLMCAHYAFPPNSLHYCGPHKAKTVQNYLEAGTTDPELIEILQQFETLYPYLSCIAHANNIADPFDPRVVEAYWIGNMLLKKVSMPMIYEHYTQGLGLKKRLKKSELTWLFGKIEQGAQAHHTFHVFNIFTRTGHHSVKHTLSSIDDCKISWGQVLSSHKDTMVVQYEPIILHNGSFALGPAIARTIHQPFPQTFSSASWVSFHWGVVCGELRAQQVRTLRAHTLHALQLANTTL